MSVSSHESGEIDVADGEIQAWVAEGRGSLAKGVAPGQSLWEVCISAESGDDRTTLFGTPEQAMAAGYMLIAVAERAMARRAAAKGGDHG